jgi:hypothetical protein
MASVVARWLVVILSEEKDLSGEILRRLSLLIYESFVKVAVNFRIEHS